MQKDAGTLSAHMCPPLPGEVSLYRNAGREALPAGMRACDPG